MEKLDLQKNKTLFLCEGDQALAQLPREVVESPSFKIFKSNLDIGPVVQWGLRDPA